MYVNNRYVALICDGESEKCACDLRIDINRCIWRPGGKVQQVKEPAANPDDTGQKEGANSHKLFPDLSMCSVAHVFDTYSQINKSNDLKIGIR